MQLELTFGRAYCYTPDFTINGIDAAYEDFGDKYDASPEDAENYGCGNMVFEGREFSEDIAAKYSINELEYNLIVQQLEIGLSFGSCGWCI